MFVLRTLGSTSSGVGLVALATQPEEQQQGALCVGHGRLPAEEFADAGAVKPQLACEQGPIAAAPESWPDDGDDSIPKRGFRARTHRSAPAGARLSLVYPLARFPDQILGHQVDALNGREQEVQVGRMKPLH